MFSEWGHGMGMRLRFPPWLSERAFFKKKKKMKKKKKLSQASNDLNGE
jgi:hypothetical protein